MADKINLTDSLRQLEEIAQWFDQQQDVDVEVGLTKVRQAAKLIKDSKTRLSEIDNEFKTIEKEIGGEDESDEGRTEEAHVERQTVNTDSDEPINLEDIPF